MMKCTDCGREFAPGNKLMHIIPGTPSIVCKKCLEKTLGVKYDTLEKVNEGKDFWSKLGKEVQKKADDANPYKKYMSHIDDK